MANKEKNFASAVIYVHNAENRIEKFVNLVADVLTSNFEHSEILCVNDFSQDRSVELIKKVANNRNNATISVLNMSYFHGIELAMNAGVDLSIGDFVFEFDSSFCDYDESLIMQTYKKALEGYDIVSASINKKARPTSKLFYKLFSRYSSNTSSMTTESFRVLSRRVINRISSMNKSVPYRKAVYASCGLKTYNIKYDSINGEKQKVSKEENKYRTRLATDSLLIFTDIGFKISILMTLLMIFTALFVGAYAIVLYCLGRTVEGWTTTILFLSFAFLCLFVILSIVVKYLQIITSFVFKRKKYNFESIEKLSK